MKKSLQCFSFFGLGMLFFSACSEGKVGESTQQIAEEIEIDEVELSKDTLPFDTLIEQDANVVTTPTPPPAPMPPNPWPDPEPRPWPPEPIPDPRPVPDPPRFEDPFADVVDFPTSEAEYPGGEIALKKFIVENVKYPEIDKEVENQGKVFLEFVVEKDGALSSIKVLRGVSPTIDKEAMRIARLMPKWIPAKSDRETVRCRMRLPITFTLY